MGRPKGSVNGVRTLVTRECERCGKPFQRSPGHVTGARYCSMACYRPQRPLVVCLGCGKEYLPSTSTRGRYCSQECMRCRVMRHCTQCGKTFSVRASKASRYNYCSMTCKRAATPTVTCQTCGKPIKVHAVRVSTFRYCSNACRLAAHRETIICAFCGRERTLRKYRVAEGARCCSNRCATLLRMRDGFEPGYFGNKRRTGYRTDIERLTEAVLVELGITYLFEHKVGRFSVDFVLPEKGIALECDGWQHKTLRGQARDAMRDEILTREGWHVIHIADKEIRADARHAVMSALALLH
jgi:very-short-patch-repair endonuclease